MDLPTDVIFEALSKSFSLRTLDTCKMVSKDWCQRLHERKFTLTNCKNTGNVFGLYIQYQKRFTNVIEFLSIEEAVTGRRASSNDIASFVTESLKDNNCRMVKIEASSKQGILCIFKESNGNRKRYFICKPSTKEICRIPNPKWRYETARVDLVVLSSKPLAYKLVRLSRDPCPNSSRLKNCNYYVCEVFDSRTLRWKRLKDNIQFPDGVFLDLKNESLVVGELIYWPTTDRQVVVFNHKDENCSWVSLPDELKDRNSGKYMLVEINGKLGLVTKSSSEEAEEREEDVQLWSVADSKHYNWYQTTEENSCGRLIREIMKVRKSNIGELLFFFRSDSEPSLVKDPSVAVPKQ